MSETSSIRWGRAVHSDLAFELYEDAVEPDPPVYLRLDGISVEPVAGKEDTSVTLTLPRQFASTLGLFRSAATDARAGTADVHPNILLEEAAIRLEKMGLNGQAAVARAVKAPVRREAPVAFSLCGQSVSLSGAQLLEALNLVAPDRATNPGQLADNVTLQYGPGHSGNGLYCCLTDYPGKGSICLTGDVRPVAATTPAEGAGVGTARQPVPDTHGSGEVPPPEVREATL